MLFRFRLDRLSDTDRSRFMASNGLSFEQVSNEAKAERKDSLIGLAGVTEATFFTTSFYK